MNGQQPILRMEGISKRFPGVQALNNVHLEVLPGEIHGLLGENGAGKSTLMKILSGVYKRETGRIVLDGQDIEVNNPHHAQTLGITIIHQELNLMPNLTVAENVFIGREPNTATFVQWRALHRQTRELMRRLGMNLSPTALVRNLSVAEQQMVEIARALSVESRVIIMDEPTSALTENEVMHLFSIMRDLRTQGLGIIFISHRMDEVFEICDRITVLRDGEYVGTVNAAQTNRDEIIRMMVGRAVSEFFGHGESHPGEVVLEVHNLSKTGTADDPDKRVVKGASFSIRKGEIVGLAGLVGSGRTDLARCIFGVDRRDSGEIIINGQPVAMKSPRDAIRAGMGMVPEDRKLQALFLAMSVEANASIGSLGDVARFGFINGRLERRMVGAYVNKLNIRLARFDQRALDLSGGNQQKVVISRWLALKPQILIMDEPTRGIDVGAKAEVHALIRQLAQEGVAILMISSELPEVLAMSDRVLVMHEGEIVGQLSGAEARSPGSAERIGAMMTGEHDHAAAHSIHELR
ncbi:MAG: sugar ABC transporter ATP-binding protein [Chloroflexi bacterium]|nr:sugar ABC transporter ATP-binding protein [Chloroflexota bacterium]